MEKRGGEKKDNSKTVGCSYYTSLFFVGGGGQHGPVLHNVLES